MTLPHTNEVDYITCKAFNLFMVLLPVSRSGHAMLDLTSFVKADQPSAYVDPGNEWSFLSVDSFAASAKTPVPPLADADDPDKEHIVGSTKQDHSIYVPGRSRLIRVHLTPRRHLFVPQENSPVKLKLLDNARTTEATFENDESVVHNDNWRGKNVEPLEKPWTGKTLFRIGKDEGTVDAPV